MVSLKEIVSFVEKMGHFALTAKTHLDRGNKGLAIEVLEKAEYASIQMADNIEKSQPMIIGKQEVENLILWEDEIASTHYEAYKALPHCEEKYDEQEELHFLEFMTIPYSYQKEVKL